MYRHHYQIRRRDTFWMSNNYFFGARERRGTRQIVGTREEWRGVGTLVGVPFAPTNRPSIIYISIVRGRGMPTRVPTPLRTSRVPTTHLHRYQRAMRATSRLHGPFSTYIGYRRHGYSDDEQECPAQPDGRENAQALDQDACQSQSYRTQRTRKHAADAEYPAP